MNFFGYRIEKISIIEEQKLEEAVETLQKHGFRAVRITKDKSNKITSMKKANNKRTEDTKKKIIDAITLLKEDEKKINVANIVSISGVSRITAKKYLDLLD